MKIEKVNDTQIRCTLTKEDLAERQIKLSELAYGSEKAKTLFRDMIQQAAFEFGFEAENIPLTIEAIPLSTDAIILIITKVEYPEELDTRFSQFSAAPDEDDFEKDTSVSETPLLEGAEEVMKLFDKLKERANNQKTREQEGTTSDTAECESAPIEEDPIKPITKLFCMNSLSEVEQAAFVLSEIYTGSNDLYHNLKDEKYYLFLHRGEHSLEEFNKVCNILSEYSKQVRFTSATEAFYKEHYKPVLSGNALQVIHNL